MCTYFHNTNYMESYMMTNFLIYMHVIAAKYTRRRLFQKCFFLLHISIYILTVSLSMVRVKKTLRFVVLRQRLSGATRNKTCSHNSDNGFIMLNGNTCDKTVLSQWTYTACWLCTFGLYIQLYQGANCAFSASDNFRKQPFSRLWALPVLS